MNTGLTEGQFIKAFSLIDQTINQPQGDIARAMLEKGLAVKNVNK